MFRCILPVTFLVATNLIALAADLPQGASLLDAHLVWDLEPDSSPATDIQDPVFAVSPDDQAIAYISRGAVWQCNVTRGPATKLVELPNSKTAVLAMPEYRDFWNGVLAARNSTIRNRYEGRMPRISVGVHSLCWTPSQDGIVYTQSSSSDVRPWTVEYRVMHVSNDCAVKPISRFERNSYDEPHRFYAFHVTRDMRHIIASNGYQVLIIVAATGKPRATCFDALVPSSTSDRFLGIEIDTRQLVLVDEEFNVKRRFDVICNAKRHFDLLWSPDERFAVCREYLEHPSSSWTGFRVDLTTGEKRELDGAHKFEQCIFSGHRSELIRIGAFPNVFGDTYVSVVPDSHKPQSDIVRWPNVQKLDPSQTNGRYPAVRMSRDAQLFAMAFLRAGRAPGYRYFLVDRDDNRWPCAADDPSRRVSPYHVVAIANGGKTIVACNETQLFSIPIESIQNATAPETK
jgi:hypothetical protein